MDKKTEFKAYHSSMGIDSGYPVCCIQYFLFRWWFYDTLSKVSPRLVSYVRPKLMKFTSKLVKSQHCLCPKHLAKAYMGWYKIEYFYCKHCDWVQLNNNVCNLCHIPVNLKTHKRDHNKSLFEKYRKMKLAAKRKRAQNV